MKRLPTLVIVWTAFFNIISSIYLEKTAQEASTKRQSMYCEYLVRFFILWLDNLQFFRKLRQYFDPVSCHDNIIFDAHTRD